MRWATLGRGRLYFWLLTLPAVLYVAAWRLAPALYTIWLSMTQYNMVYDTLPRWNHLDNFRRILHDAGLAGSLQLSVEFALIATAAESTLGVTLLIGWQTRRSAIAAAVLLFLFGTGMTIGTGIKSAFDASVFAASAGALVLACAPRYPFSIDARSSRVPGSS